MRERGEQYHRQAERHEDERAGKDQLREPEGDDDSPRDDCDDHERDG